VVNCKENLGRAAVAFKLAVPVQSIERKLNFQNSCLHFMGFSQNLGVQKLISSKKYVVCSKKN
jgi:hypothetical protein